MTYTTIYFDITEVISGFLMILTLLCIYKHPKIEPILHNFIVSIFFEDRHLNPSYREPKIITSFEFELLDAFNTERWRYKLVDDESLISVIKKGKKAIVILTIILTKLAGFCEKMKNLVTWQDQRRSFMFIGITLLGFCIFALVPLKLIALTASKNILIN